MDYIVSWFYAETKNMKSSYSQVKADSTSNKFQEVYWRCVASFFATSKKYNPNKKHLFYTNLSNIPTGPKFNYKDFLSDLEVEVRNVELSTKTPVDWHSAWRNQFYVFDIMQDLQIHISSSDNILILDSDCIINKNLDNLFMDVQKYGVIVYDCGYPDNHTVNGLTTVQMGNLYFEYYQTKESINYYGGEFIAINGGILSNILEEYKFIWSKNFKKYEDGLLKLTEEAHFLSLIYHRLKTTKALGNHYIKRMWNTRAYNNIIDNDIDLPIFHLPSQKTTGFKYFFKRSIIKEQSLTQMDIINIFDIKKNKTNARKLKEIGTKVMFMISK